MWALTLELRDLCVLGMECLQSIRGAELLSMIRGTDIWRSLRTIPVEIEKLTSRGDSRKTNLTFEFMCCPHESVGNLKERLRDVIAAPIIKLIHSGTMLENSRTLSDYGISAGSKIFVLDTHGRAQPGPAPDAGASSSVEDDPVEQRQRSVAPPPSPARSSSSTAV